VRENPCDMTLSVSCAKSSGPCLATSPNALPMFYFLICAESCSAQKNTEIRSDAVDVLDCSDSIFFSFTGNTTAVSDKFGLPGDQFDIISSKGTIFCEPVTAVALSKRFMPSLTLNLRKVVGVVWPMR